MRRGGFKPKKLMAVAMCLLFAGIGLVFLADSRAAFFSSGVDGGQDGVADIRGATSGNRLLVPYSMGLAPYAYVPYGNVTMAAYADATGAKNFFAAFILGSGCTPAWDGENTLKLSSSRGAAIATDIASVRAKGGDVAVSFGGESGTELANSCTDARKLQGAYQSVITKYSLKHINLDLEYEGESDAAAMARRVEAIKALQVANPGLKVSLTVPVETTGLTPAALNTVQKFHDGGVVVSSIGVMAMIFGPSAERQSDRVVAAVQGTVSQLKKIYPGISTEEAHKAVNIIVLPGYNSDGEIFTTIDATAVKDFATQNGIGTLSFWSANRDKPCGMGASISEGTCSGTAQSANQFGQLMAMPAM